MLLKKEFRYQIVQDAQLYLTSSFPNKTVHLVEEVELERFNLLIFEVIIIVLCTIYTSHILYMYYIYTVLVKVFDECIIFLSFYLV